MNGSDVDEIGGACSESADGSAFCGFIKVNEGCRSTFELRLRSYRRFLPSTRFAFEVRRRGENFVLGPRLANELDADRKTLG